MCRMLTGLLVLGLSACQCGPATGPDGGADAGGDAGPIDGGPPDAGPFDAGPRCVEELCDGIDNDCNGSIDLLVDGGPLTQLCPLQLGTCQGASVQCQSGRFPTCRVEYGAKYEEHESLCDGVDNDCSGFVDVSQWRPIAAAPPVGADGLFAVSVPGGWYVGTGSTAQMFDEQLKPTSDPFPVGRTGAMDIVSSTAISFGGQLNQLFTQLPLPGATYLRRLNLDGTYALGLDGGALEIALLPGHTAPLSPGALRASHDRKALLVAFTEPAAQHLLTLWPDGGTRAPLTLIGNAGQWRYQSAAVGADGFVVAIPYPSRLQLQLYSPQLTALGLPVDLATGADATRCAVSTHTTATTAGSDSVVVACPDAHRLYAAQNIFVGGTLNALWEADAGTIADVRVLPSYASATVFWVHALPGAPSTIWMSQLNGVPVSIAELQPSPERIDFAPSLRGGYLLEAVFDGGQGFRPYGAYVCPP